MGETVGVKGRCKWVPGVGEVVKALPDLQHVFTCEQSFLRSSAHGLQLHLGIEQTAAQSRHVNVTAAPNKDTVYFK